MTNYKNLLSLPVSTNALGAKTVDEYIHKACEGKNLTYNDLWDSDVFENSPESWVLLSNAIVDKPDTLGLYDEELDEAIIETVATSLNLDPFAEDTEDEKTWKQDFMAFMNGDTDELPDGIEWLE